MTSEAQLGGEWGGCFRALSSPSPWGSSVTGHGLPCIAHRQSAPAPPVLCRVHHISDRLRWNLLLAAL